MAAQGRIYTDNPTDINVSLTQTTEPITPLYEFKAGNVPMRLHELNISVDSGFQDNAYFKIEIDGVVQVNNKFQAWSSANAEFDRVPTGKWLPLNANGSARIYAYNPSGQSTQSMSFSVSVMAEEVN